MIIAGPCLYVDESDKQEIIETAYEISDFVDYFRCKLWGGGTRPDRYIPGIKENGISVLSSIDKTIIQSGTEVQTPEQLEKAKNLSFVWLGARNSANYALLESLSFYNKPVMLKRGPNMTIDEVIGLYDIAKDIYKLDVYIIERGIVGIDRAEDSRWSPDLKGIIRLKHERFDIFRKTIIDCSHSVGRAEYIEDTYNAFESIGVGHFMFECTKSGKSKTDQRQMLSTERLKEILNGI